MQCLKLSKFALVLALCAAAASAAEQPETSLSTRGLVDDFQDGLDVMQKFFDIFNSQIFEGTPVGMVAEIVSKTLSTLVAIINIIKGKSAENTFIYILRTQFALLHNRFDRIEFQLNDIMNLIEWNTARIIYAQYENQIKVASTKYLAFLTARESEKTFRRNEFVNYFKSRRYAALKLYQGVVDKDVVITSSLADEVKKFSKNHRKKVMNFMLAMNRLIVRGAQMEIAYVALTGSTANANVIARDWGNRMKNYVNKMKSVESSVRAAWRPQLNADAKSMITRYSHLSNEDFAWTLYRFLTEKFDWQHWLVVAYKNVKGEDNHLIGHSLGALFFRVAGNRNVVIGRTNPKTSTWSKAKADEALKKADATNYNSSHCKNWYNIINPFYPVNGKSVTLTMAVKYGSSLTAVSLSSRRSFRFMTDKYNKKRVTAIMFG